MAGLQTSLIKEELSYAYLHILATKVGLKVDTPKIDDDSVDVEVSATGKIAEGSFVSPKVQVQLKATINCNKGNDETISFSLKKKNYDNLRANTLVPRLLVVLCLPKDQSDWVIEDAKKLVLKESACYYSLKGMEDIEKESITIHIPRKNRLTSEKLYELMVEYSKLPQP